MDTQERIMRCQIEGSWTAKDMADSLLSMRDLYNIRLGLQIIYEDYRDIDEFLFELHHFKPFRRLQRKELAPFLYQFLFSGYFKPIDPDQLNRIANLVYPYEELKVRRIEYASPGFKDLAGFGEIVGHLKDFILKLVEYHGDKRKRELNNEEQELKNQALRIENARKYVSLARECGFEERELRKLVILVDEKQEPLITLIGNGKIQSVKMMDDKNLNKENDL